MSLSKIKRSDLTFGEELGRGGFSVVYKAIWKQSLFESQEVAAKKLIKPQANEMKIMSQLEHENIVKLLAVVDENPDFYLILELCPGGSLRTYLDERRGKRLPEDQFYDWAKQAARSIEYLKKMGIIHKDVKSENYVIADHNILKLTDFGLAKEIDATIENATGSATYAYMAPELLKDFILSPSYDIFSYGVVVYELWTTQKPFEGVEGYAIIWKVCHLNERPPIPDDCPEPIADLMRQCWLEKWKDRPSIDHVLTVVRPSQLNPAPQSCRAC
ncbi:mitogen-activated protein kinase kinase kinase 20-like [Amphiura filiformis]|uniref:mitogen-activated protein kinase kinase kinase 20-like n=1 Tax=Amphiura filiformis TaxID=82378 RepID=UPI003B20DA31